MGFGGISPVSLLLILLIVLLLFGTKKLRNMGGDLGSAIKNFKSSMGVGASEKDAAGAGERIDHQQPQSGHVYDAEMEGSDKDKT